MCLIRNNHDIVSICEDGKSVFCCFQPKFLDSGENDATGGPILQVFPQFRPGAGLFGCFAQQIPGTGENAKQLAIQFLSVGDNDQSRVLQTGFRDQTTCQAGHFQGFAGSLGLPDNTSFLAAFLPRGDHNIFYRHLDCMKLMVTGYFLDDGLFVLENAEVAQVAEEHLFVEQSFDECFQLPVLAKRINFSPVNGAPAHEAFFVG